MSVVPPSIAPEITSPILPSTSISPRGSVRDGAFARFWIAQTFASTGDAVILIALPLLVLATTGSVAQMGFITGLLGIGRLVASLVSGLILDRVDRRAFLIWCAALASLCFLAIPVIWWLLGPQLIVLYAITAPVAALETCVQVGTNVAVTNLVDREEYAVATSRLQTSAGISFLLGPVLAGVAAGQFGAATAILLQVAMYAIFAVLLATVRFAPTPSAGEQPQSHRLAEFFAGLCFLAYDRFLRWTLGLRVAVIIVVSGAIDLIIYRLQHDLRESPTSVGVVFGLSALGGIAGGVLAPWLRKRFGVGPIFLIGMLAEGIVCVAFGLNTSLTLAVALGIAYFFSDTLSLINAISLRQERTPNYLLGRVSAANQMLISLGAPIGATAAATLAQHLGAGNVLFAMGGLITALGLIGWLTPARLRAPGL